MEIWGYGLERRESVMPRAPAEAYPARAQTRRVHKVPPGTHKASTTTKRKGNNIRILLVIRAQHN